jgi:hypothetical protein
VVVPVSDDVARGARMTVPVIGFLIAHPRGNVLVDTGVHRQALTDPVGRLGRGPRGRPPISRGLPFSGGLPNV